MERILQSRLSNCYPLNLLVTNIALACVVGALACVAFSQLTRIHMWNQQVGWTRQKVLHLMIGSSNIGYFIYFISTLVATCKRWPCWSHACGFILMACPKILFLAAFLLVLSFWVDLCHQANDEEDNEENSGQQTLLENNRSKLRSSNMDGYRRWCLFQGVHVGSRQKFVTVVVLLIFMLMMSFALVIWIGAGKNPIDSSLVAQVYVDFSATGVLMLGGGIGCYGLLLFFKLRKVRSQQASSEIWKVSGLAVVCVVCFTSSALVALFTNIPLLYHWNLMRINGLKALVFLIVYYFIGSAVPSAFVLWVMRALPTATTSNRQIEPRVVTFINYEDSGMYHNQHWASSTMSTNQICREAYSCWYDLLGWFEDFSAFCFWYLRLFLGSSGMSTMVGIIRGMPFGLLVFLSLSRLGLPSKPYISEH